MIQDSLVDYIASQVKLGVSRDSIKTALVGVGWAAQDVEDTFKKVEGGSSSPVAAATAPVAVSPMASAVKLMSVSSAPAQSQPQMQKPAVASPASSGSPAAAPVSQNIRVSDLVSASLTPTSLSSNASRPANIAVKVSPMNMGQKPAVGGASSGVSGGGMGSMPKKGMSMSAYIMIGLILILAGISAYLYFQNSTLSSQVATTGGAAGQAAAAQVSDLTGQVQQLTASSTALTVQIAALSAQIAELQADLSFFMVSTGQTAGVPVAVSVMGTLSGGGKLGYWLTTAEGAKVAVKNSANADVQAALQPLVAVAGATSTPPASVQISGTHLPGVASVTVTAVNGQPVMKPAAAPVATSTTSTIMTASTTAATSTP